MGPHLSFHMSLPSLTLAWPVFLPESPSKQRLPPDSTQKHRPVSGLGADQDWSTGLRCFADRAGGGHQASSCGQH